MDETTVNANGAASNNIRPQTYLSSAGVEYGSEDGESGTQVRWNRRPKSRTRIEDKNEAEFLNPPYANRFTDLKCIEIVTATNSFGLNIPWSLHRYIWRRKRRADHHFLTFWHVGIDANREVSIR